MRFLLFLLVLLAVFVSGYSVFWGEFVHCDVGTCPYPNPEGRFLSINSTSIVFDTSGDLSAMGFYVVAVVLDKHASLSISGWWSYRRPRTMAYVVSDKGFSAMECSTGGGQVCSVSGVLSPGVYYIVLVDAWAQQTVRVTVSDGRLVLADVSPQRVACALWRAGVLAGQRLTYAFHWPSRPGVSISQDVVDSSCGPPALQEALAFAAVFGLDAREASLLVRPFGYNVTSVERRFGSVVFRLQPDLTYVVPLVFDVQLGGQGRLLLVNPSNATVRWAVKVHLSNKSGVGSPRGPPVMSFDVVVPPRSARDFYLYGSAEKEGFYVLSYRLRVLNESASWGGSSFYVRNRLAAQNGSVLNFLWGLGERVAGAVWRDRCLSARGAGRMRAASKLGLAGVATEADVVAGVYSLFATGGSLLGVKLGESAAKASSSAVKLAGRLVAAGRAVAYADLLAHGVLLGWDAYLDVSSGRIPWEEVADAALLAAGPVAARVKSLAAVLAGGGAVMLYLGEPLNLSASFAEELYAAAPEYGEYADCFVAGALQAFSTYAQVVEAARWVGIASSFVDVASLLNNKYWLGYRQLAALAAFDYEQPVPVFKIRELLRRIGGGVDAVMFGKHMVGVRETGDVAVMKARDNGRRFEVTSLKLQSSATISSSGGYEIRISKYKAGTASYLVSEVVDINTKRLVVVGYNDMFTALAIARGFRGDIYRGVYKDRELYIISYDFDRSLIDAVEANPETFYKYLSTALMPEIVGVNPAAVGAEVTLPAVFDKRWRWDLVIADTAFGKTAFVPLRSGGLRVDILGILDDGRLLIGEVKNMEGVGGPADLGLGDVAERAKVLGDLLRDNSALLSALVSVYNGGRLPGGGKVSSSFMASQVLMFPGLRKIFGQGGVKFVVVAADARKAVVFVYDVSLNQLQVRGFLDRVAEEVFYGFKLAEARDSLYSVDEAVRRVVDRYEVYTKYVEFLKS